MKISKILGFICTGLVSVVIFEISFINSIKSKAANHGTDKFHDHNDDNSMWFNKLKEIADKNGYASDMKAYKANPENFKGNVSDVAEVVRIAVTGRANTPDLWTIVHIMGEEQMKERISRFL